MELNGLCTCSQMGVRKFYKILEAHLKNLRSRRVTTNRYLTQGSTKIRRQRYEVWSPPGICSSLSEDPSLVDFLRRMDRSSPLIFCFFKDKFAFSPHLRLLLQIRLINSQISYAYLVFLMRVKI